MQPVPPPVVSSDTAAQLQARLFTVLDYIGEAMKSTADAASEQIPLVAHDVVRWGVWACTAYLVLYAFLIGLALYLLFKSLKWSRTQMDIQAAKSNEYRRKEGEPPRRGTWSDLSDGEAVLSIFAPVACCICIILVILCDGTHTASQLIKASVAPRVYVIEWVAQEIRCLK